MVRKVAQYMADVLEDSRDKVQENLLANGGTMMFNGYNTASVDYVTSNLTVLNISITWYLLLSNFGHTDVAKYSLFLLSNVT